MDLLCDHIATKHIAVANSNKIRHFFHYGHRAILMPCTVICWESWILFGAFSDFIETVVVISNRNKAFI